MKLKIIQLNLWHGGKFFGPIVDFLKSEDPDILICQEVHGGVDPKLPVNLRTTTGLSKAISLPFYYFSPCMRWSWPEGKIPWGNAVFSKTPIISGEENFYYGEFGDWERPKTPDFSNIPRNLQHVQIKIGRSALNIFNNHGIWGFDGDDNEERLKMADFILKKITGQENVILAGDFNVKENTQTIGKIQNILNDPFKGERKSSFNMKQKDKNSGYGTAVVDFIFTGTDIKVLEHSQPDVDISDHLPLVVELEVNT